jgi:hypothetical protein
MHTRRWIRQSQFLAAAHSRYHTDIVQALLRTNIPIGSPIGAKIYPEHLDATTKQVHGRHLLHVHTRMVERVTNYVRHPSRDRGIARDRGKPRDLSLSYVARDRGNTRDPGNTRDQA